MASTARGAAVSFALSVLAVCVGDGPLLAATCPAGRATGAKGDTLVVGFAAAPPFVVVGSTDRGARGYAIDLLRAIADHEGWRLELTQLSPETLRARLAGCELDLGVDGVAASAALADKLELSQPYLSTVTTAIVHAHDLARATPAGRSRSGRLARVVLRGLLYAAGALGALAVASWLLNAFTGFPGRQPVRWRRIDASISGPSAGLRWLARSTTGRVLVGAWLAAGIAVGVTGALGAAPPLVLGADPLGKLVEAAAHREVLVGERYPDGARVTCAASEVRDCFRGLAQGTLAAIAGPREVLCAQASDLALDDAVVRDDLAIPEHLTYLLPPGSPLRARLDHALLAQHERAGLAAPIARCPGDAR
ncbi:MAG: transporter substrate-binding domain-containing protein [Deltaproteobacteria bacterium]|nr:MAG: transporter substrate-binding domain-containing protein [Deltaproteobacteria bacterium]TMQ19916.1 MAG: transporter substrate-binding domain-containing protein [Deltaproteobacteria bacterium]